MHDSMVLSEYVGQYCRAYNIDMLALGALFTFRYTRMFGLSSGSLRPEIRSSPLSPFGLTTSGFLEVKRSAIVECLVGTG